MGCFSFMCLGCNQPINSSSFRGERCILFLLKNGSIIEKMQGEYDSYGRVFDENGKSIEWKSYPWSHISDLKDFIYPEGEEGITVCDLMFRKERNNGIAAYHEECYNGGPVIERSLDDPDQGWGEFVLPPNPFKENDS